MCAGFTPAVCSETMHVRAMPIHLRESLRSATHDAHVALEARLDLAGRPWTRDTYAAFLRATLAVVDAVEPAIRHWRLTHGSTTDVIPPSQRLRHDLAALGDDRGIHAVPVPRIDDAATAFGAAYVLEGSRLGGQVIARTLESRLGLSAEAMTYLRPPDQPVGAAWRAFVNDLDAFGAAAPPASWRAAEACARAMFAAFGAAFTAEGLA